MDSSSSCCAFNVEEEVVVIRNGWTPKKKKKETNIQIYIFICANGLLCQIISMCHNFDIYFILEIKNGLFSRHISGRLRSAGDTFFERKIGLLV